MLFLPQAVNKITEAVKDRIIVFFVIRFLNINNEIRVQ